MWWAALWGICVIVEVREIKAARCADAKSEKAFILEMETAMTTMDPLLENLQKQFKMLQGMQNLRSK